MERVTYQLTCQLEDIFKFSTSDNIKKSQSRRHCQHINIMIPTSLKVLECVVGVSFYLNGISLLWSSTFWSSQQLNWEGFEWDFSQRWTDVYRPSWLRGSIVNLTDRNVFLFTSNWANYLGNQILFEQKRKHHVSDNFFLILTLEMFWGENRKMGLGTWLASLWLFSTVCFQVKWVGRPD